MDGEGSRRHCVAVDGTSIGEFVVDIAFRTWHNIREPEEPYGATPGMVGRKQRRFIVWHSAPKGLDTPAAARVWLTEALVDTERLVRE
jgi:hypothetical protein